MYQPFSICPCISFSYSLLVYIHLSLSLTSLFNRNAFYSSVSHIQQVLVVVFWSGYVDSWNKSKTVSQLQQFVSEVRKVRSKRYYLSEAGLVPWYYIFNHKTWKRITMFDVSDLFCLVFEGILLLSSMWLIQR